MAETTYLLRKYDDVTPTHAMREVYLPPGEIWQANGYMFVPPELAAGMGEADSSVTFGEFTYPAWRMPSWQLTRRIAREKRSPIPWHEFETRVREVLKG